MLFRRDLWLPSPIARFNITGFSFLIQNPPYSWLSNLQNSTNLIYLFYHTFLCLSLLFYYGIAVRRRIHRLSAVSAWFWRRQAVPLSLRSARIPAENRCSPPVAAPHIHDCLLVNTGSKRRRRGALKSWTRPFRSADTLIRSTSKPTASFWKRRDYGSCRGALGGTAELYWGTGSVKGQIRGVQPPGRWIKWHCPKVVFAQWNNASILLFFEVIKWNIYFYLAVRKRRLFNLC